MRPVWGEERMRPVWGEEQEECRCGVRVRSFGTFWYDEAGSARCGYIQSVPGRNGRWHAPPELVQVTIFG